jgi:hypothetical protein
MKTLDEAWDWFRSTRKSLSILRRLAARYWDDLPWDDRSKELWKDAHLRTVEADPLIQEIEHALSHLDDLAVVALFSVFEATVRAALESELSREIPALKHVILRSSAAKALETVREGSIKEVLEHYKTDFNKSFVEEIDQVRDYRNGLRMERRGRCPRR